MSTPTSVGCFFLDCNIILSDILKQSTSRIEKLKQDAEFHRIQCYISNSVKDEINEKVQRTCDYLGRIVRDVIRTELVEDRTKKGVSLESQMTSDDVKVLERLFSSMQDAARMTRIPLIPAISIVEEWAISYLGEKFDKGEAVNIHDFEVELTKKLLETSSSIQDPYDYIVEFERAYVKTKTLSPDPTVLSALQSVGMHKPDDLHVASAFRYQTDTGEKTVFVTLDYETILARRFVILNKLGIAIECCDPLYALHHLF